MPFPTKRNAFCGKAWGEKNPAPHFQAKALKSNLRLMLFIFVEIVPGKKLIFLNELFIVFVLHVA